MYVDSSRSNLRSFTLISIGSSAMGVPPTVLLSPAPGSAPIFVFPVSGAEAPFSAGPVSFNARDIGLPGFSFSFFSPGGFGVPDRLGPSLSSSAKAASNTAGSGLAVPSGDFEVS